MCNDLELNSEEKKNNRKYTNYRVANIEKTVHFFYLPGYWSICWYFVIQFSGPFNSQFRTQLLRNTGIRAMRNKLKTSQPCIYIVEISNEGKGTFNCAAFISSKYYTVPNSKIGFSFFLWRFSWPKSIYYTYLFLWNI